MKLEHVNLLDDVEAPPSTASLSPEEMEDENGPEPYVMFGGLANHHGPGIRAHQPFE